jgi:hypothetical protein
MIAQQAGLVELEWDGNLKRSLVPDRLKAEQKNRFFEYLARKTQIRNYRPEEVAEIGLGYRGQSIILIF